VAKVRGLPTTEDEINKILQDATNAAGAQNCSFILQRSGPLRELTADISPIRILSVFDFIEMRAQPQDLTIVEDIEWCGKYDPTFVGCAELPGRILVVEHRILGLDGLVWLHEVGHTRGLEHVVRDKALMHERLGEDKKEITVDECLVLVTDLTVGGSRSGSSDPDDFNVAPQTAPSPQSNDGSSPPVEDLVASVWTGGIPIEIAIQYGEEEAAKLREMMVTPRYKLYLRNIVPLVGLVGGEQAFTTLQDFLKRARNLDEVDFDISDGVSFVPVAYGFLAGLHEDRRAFAELSRGVRPNHWAGLIKAQTTEDAFAFAERMSRRTVVGLTYVGTEEAAGVLREVFFSLERGAFSYTQSVTDPGAASAVGAADMNFLRGALDSANTVREKGLIEYLR